MSEKQIKTLNLLTLVTRATEIVIDGHLFKRDERGWQIWLNLTELVYTEVTEKTADRTSHKFGVRQSLSKKNPLEIFHCHSLPICHRIAVELAEELKNE